MASRFLAPFSSGLGGRSLEPLLDLHREFNRLFEDMFSVAGVPTTAGGTAGSLMTMPRLDVREGEKELCISAELPGVKASGIDLRIEGDMLILSGEKKNEIDQKQENYHLMERSYGQFRRSVQLPFAPDPDQVQASFDHGVLTIRMPRPAQQERSRRIEIRSEGSQESQLLQHAASGGTVGSEDAPQHQGAQGNTGGIGGGQGVPTGVSTH